MRQIMKIAFPAALALMLASPAGAGAADPSGFYLGASAGMTDHGKCEITPAPSSCDPEDTGYKGYVGYQINRWLGFEAGYADLGKTKAVINGGNFEFKATGIPVQVTLGWQWDNGFGVFGKVGAVFWEAKGNFTGVSQTENGVGFAGGVGVQWFFTKNFGVRAEIEAFPDVGKETTSGQADISLLTAGVVIKF